MASFSSIYLLHILFDVWPVLLALSNIYICNKICNLKHYIVKYILMWDDVIKISFLARFN